MMAITAAHSRGNFRSPGSGLCGRSRWKIRRFAIAVLTLGAASCQAGGGPTPPDPPALTSVTVTLTPDVIMVGKTATATAVGTDQYLAPMNVASVTWASESNAIATVSVAGLVSGVTPGRVAIFATASGRTAFQTLTVIPIPVASVVVTPPELTLIAGAAQQLVASTRDVDGTELTGRSVTWATSSAARATVSASGLVTAVAVGSATLTATSEGKSGTAAVTVLPKPVAMVTVTPAAPSLVIGTTQQLAVTTRDAGGALLTGRTVTWATSDASKATVSASGLVSAVAVGGVVITATSEGKAGSVVVTVLPMPVATVTVTPAAAAILVGGNQQLAATTRDANGAVVTGRSVSWATSGASRVTVSASGLVTAVAVGSAVITATSEGRSGTATITVTAIMGDLTCSGTPRLGCGLGADQFTLIPAGTFQMGSAVNASGTEMPVHSVTISQPFYMQKTEVTQGQWRAVMGSSLSDFAACGDTCAVDQAGWPDVQTFLLWLNTRTPGVSYRLPTEAEWEYAARAGSSGETYGSLDAIAWYASNSASTAHAVAGKQSNAWGLYDTIGNVWEWVNDLFDSNYYASSPGTDPTGPAFGLGHVLRGGSWGSPTISARAPYRNGPAGTSGSRDYGFRLVRVP